LSAHNEASLFLISWKSGGASVSVKSLGTSVKALNSFLNFTPEEWI